MSDKKLPTVAQLQKKIEKLKQKEQDIINLFEITKTLAKEVQVKYEKDVSDLKTALRQSRQEYQRACSVVRHLSGAINKLTEE